MADSLRRIELRLRACYTRCFARMMLRQVPPNSCLCVCARVCVRVSYMQGCQCAHCPLASPRAIPRLPHTAPAPVYTHIHRPGTQAPAHTPTHTHTHTHTRTQTSINTPQMHVTTPACTRQETESFSPGASYTILCVSVRVCVCACVCLCVCVGVRRVSCHVARV